MASEKHSAPDESVPAGPSRPPMAAAELAERLGTPRAPLVVDVREPDEFASWSIPGARNIPLAQLGARTAEIDTDRDVVVLCASGSRSAAAASLLAGRDIPVFDLLGGMAAWATVYDSASIGLGGAQVVQIRRRGKGCLSYVLGAGGEAFVVDPSMDTARYLDMAERHGWRLTRVFDTHLHADHVSGARMLAMAAGATLHCNPSDAFSFAFEPLVDGASFDLGGTATLGVVALDSPGHTLGSTVFDLGGEALLSGDTLFVDGVGRPDLAERAEEFARLLYASLHKKLLGRGDDVLVLPAHYGDAVAVHPGEVVSATLGALRRDLAPLAFDEETFVAWASSRATPRPPNYADVIRVNIAGADHQSEAYADLEVGPNRCSV